MLRLDLPPEAATRGVFTRAEAVAAGWTERAIRTRLAAGTWRELGRGAYVDAVSWAAADRTTRHRFESLAVGLSRKVVIAGPSAAIVHGFAVLRTPQRVCSLRGDTMPAPEVTRVHDVDLTPPDRTVLDCARRDGVEAGVVVADSAIRAGAVTREGLRHQLQASTLWPRSRVARRAVDEADGRAESALESLSRVRFVAAELPRPELQAMIRVATGECFWVDFLWRSQRVIGEADGMVKYDDPSVLRAEKRRELLLADAGFEVVRWSWDEMWRTPDAVCRRVLRTFGRAAARFAL